MKKLLYTALIAITGISCLDSCAKKDADPMGDYVCTCFRIIKIDSVSVKLDTILIDENMIEKSVATSYCANAQATYTDTFGSVAHCALNK